MLLSPSYRLGSWGTEWLSLAQSNIIGKWQSQDLNPFKSLCSYSLASIVISRSQSWHLGNVLESICVGVMDVSLSQRTKGKEKESKLYRKQGGRGRVVRCSRRLHTWSRGSAPTVLCSLIDRVQSIWELSKSENIYWVWVPDSKLSSQIPIFYLPR